MFALTLTTQLVGCVVITLVVSWWPSCRSRPEPPRTPVALADITARPSTLRVCAHPNNLPFSNERGQGFENKIAELIAADLGRRLEYAWWMQPTALRQAPATIDCDLIIGVPSDVAATLTTQPYYRSTYVFVTRRDRGWSLSTLDDSDLRRLRIGVQLGGDDAAPARGLSRRGIIRNVVPFSPPAHSKTASDRLINAVANGDLDVAVAWGPRAGYFASKHRSALRLSPIPATDVDRSLPYALDISMGVRRTDQDLRDRLNEIIDQRRREIDRVLETYHVPRLALTDGP